MVLGEYDVNYGKPSYWPAKIFVTKEDVPLFKKEVSVLVNLDRTSTEAAPTRPKMPIMTLDLPAVEYTAEDVHKFQ